MSYIFFAFLSAFFAALTSILAKIGMKKINSNLATALRCIVVVAFSWIVAFLTTNIPKELFSLSYKTLLFLVLSGITTGASWMCYFHALKIGNVNVVVPIDKSSIVFTIILSSLIFPDENFTFSKGICTLLIGIGTFMMIEPSKKKTSKKRKSAVFYAFLGAIFAALTSILGKEGVSVISSDLGSAIRCIVVLVMAWVIVFTGNHHKFTRKLDLKSAVFIILSGIATGASWLCYYRALSQGPASIVASIDKLGIVFTVFMGYAFFKEKISKKGIIGLLLIVTGTLLLLIC